MSAARIARAAVLLAVSAVCKVKAFVVTGRVTGSTHELLTRQSSTVTKVNRPSLEQQRRITPDARGTARVAQALEMSSYEGEGSTSSSGEPQYEMQELIVDFTDDGRVLLEVKGVKGPECKQITEELIKALGDVIHTENTAEYFEERLINTNAQHESVQVGWSYDTEKPQW